MRIGVLDSGIGGLSVAQSMLKQMPYLEIVYYADNKNAPYGNKTQHEIQNFVYTGFVELLKYKIQALFLACNTASVSGVIDIIKTQYSQFSVFGMHQILDIILPRIVVRPCFLIATEFTLSKTIYNTICKEQNLIPLPSKNLALEIENGLENQSLEQQISFLESEFPILKKTQFAQTPMSLILGCTHYSFIYETFKYWLPNATIFDLSQSIPVDFFNDLDPNLSKKTAIFDQKHYCLTSKSTPLLEKRQRKS